MIHFQVSLFSGDIIGKVKIVMSLIQTFIREEKQVISISIMTVTEYMESILKIKSLMKVYFVMVPTD